MKAVEGSNVEVYMDGGVRQGTDIFKALALGAKAVFIGRPVFWGLAVDVRNQTCPYNNSIPRGTRVWVFSSDFFAT